MKRKNASWAANAFESIFKNFDEFPTHIITDKGLGNSFHVEILNLFNLIFLTIKYINTKYININYVNMYGSKIKNVNIVFLLTQLTLILNKLT